MGALYSQDQRAHGSFGSRLPHSLRRRDDQEPEVIGAL